MDRAQSSATTPGQSGPGSDGNKLLLCIPQSSSITGASTSNCFMSYLRRSFGGVKLLCRDSFGVFYSPSRLGSAIFWDILGSAIFWDSAYMNDLKNSVSLKSVT